ncbi:hypothetical protein HG536_0A06920 [Torulaspora globosa]|uniref:Uncharacterized protein n=1 Tax=Torulaspora globosa TaxID=48254 RepID=A0A7G3ZBJ1_9SACH|nr:uncharacterized protein HG536_0A06920 [Torulaspora globosa]QLL30877.1 hypothetical protein HG536_0A06920 [Torulaspora globosa]
MVHAKLIRKLPSVKVLTRKQIKTTMYVKSNTPYISALKRIKKFLRDLEKNGASYVVVLGMGKATEKTLSLGCHFEQQLGKKVEVLTRTVELVDEVSAESEESIENEDLRDIDRETTLKKRCVSGVELRVYP